MHARNENKRIELEDNGETGKYGQGKSKQPCADPWGSSKSVDSIHYTSPPEINRQQSAIHDSVLGISTLYRETILTTIQNIVECYCICFRII